MLKKSDVSYPLIIDDRFVSREALKWVLGTISHSLVYTSDNGLEGLGYVVVKDPSIIIIDITLPLYDGLEIFKFIATNKRLNNLEKPLIIIHDGGVIPKIKRKNAILLNKRSFGFVGSFRKCLQLMGILPIKRMSIREQLALPFVEVASFIASFAEASWIQSEKRKSILTVFFGILAGLGDMLSGFIWGLVRLIAPNKAYDANEAQRARDIKSYRVAVYPAFYTMIGIVLFVFLNIGLLVFGGMRIADIRINGVFAMSDTHFEQIFTKDKEDDFDYNSNDVLFTKYGVELERRSSIIPTTEVKPDASVEPSDSIQPITTPTSSPSVTVTPSITAILISTPSPTIEVTETITPNPTDTAVLGASDESSYPLVPVSVILKTPIVYSSLGEFIEKSSLNDEKTSLEEPSEKDQKGITYRLSPDGKKWYSWDEGEKKWDLVDSANGTRVTIKELNKNIQRYVSDYPSGDLHIAVFLQTTDSQKTPVLNSLSVKRSMAIVTTISDPKLELQDTQTISSLDFNQLETLIFNASYSKGNKIVRGKLLLKDKKTKVAYEITLNELAKFEAIVYYTNATQATRGEVIGKTELKLNARREIEFTLITPNRAGGYVTAEIVEKSVIAGFQPARSNLARPVQNSTFVVDSTGEQADETLDGLCATSLGTCTLRAAIEESNDLPGMDTINFNIPTSDPGFRDYDDPNTPNSGDSAGGDDYWKIKPATAMTSLFYFDLVGYDGQTGSSNPAIVDGFSQEVLSGINMNTAGPDIEIDGASSVTNSRGFYLEDIGGGEPVVYGAVKGITINNFKYTQLSIESGWDVDSNYICTDPRGESNVASLILTGGGTGVSSTSPNRTGVGISGYYVKVRNNLIHGCFYGMGNVNIDYGQISGNKVGVDKTGQQVRTMYTAFNTSEIERFTVIGGSGESNRNIFRSTLDSVITGYSNPASPADIINNYFGVAADGITPLSSGKFFVRGRNINDNVSSVTLALGSGSNVFNNYVGTSPIQDVNFNNPNEGMTINGATAITIYSNVIKYNGIGIMATGTVAPVISNNSINSNGIGVSVTSSSTVLQGNEIKGNTQFAIKVLPTASARTTANSTHLSTATIGGISAHSGSLCGGIQANCIENNAYGGIYLLDTLVTNEASLYTSNTFGNGNGIDMNADSKGDRNIEQGWYGLFELMSSTYRRTDLSTGITIPFPASTIVRTGDNPSTQVASATTINVSCISVITTDCPSTGHTIGTLNNTHVLAPVGSTSTLLGSISNWFRVTEYIYDGTGNKTNYGSFKFEQNHFASPTFTYDGNSTTNPAIGYTSRTISSQAYLDRGEPWTNSISATRDAATGSIGRFQIMEVEMVDANPVLQQDGTYIITVDSTVDQGVASSTFYNDGAGTATGGITRTLTTVPADGKTAFREALRVAGATIVNTKIHFNIPTSDLGYIDYDSQLVPGSGDGLNGDDYWSLNITLGDLPLLLSPRNITIDGKSQTTFGGDTNTFGPEIEISGRVANQDEPVIYNGIYIGKSGSTVDSNMLVQGLIINGFYSNMLTSGGTTIQDNYICTDAKGEAITIPHTEEYGDHYNYTGLELRGYYTKAKNNLIHSCFVGISWDGDYSHIVGNIIGLDKTGTQSRPMALGIIESEIENYSYLGGSNIGDRNYLRGDTNCAILNASQLYNVNNPSLASFAINNNCGVSMDGLIAIPSGGMQLTGFTEVKNNLSSVTFKVSGMVVSDNIVGTDRNKTLNFGNGSNSGLIYQGVGIFTNNTAYYNNIGIQSYSHTDLINNEIKHNNTGLQVFSGAYTTQTDSNSINGNLFEDNGIALDIQKYNYTVTDNEFRDTTDTVIKVSHSTAVVTMTNNILNNPGLLNTPINLVGGATDAKNSTSNDTEDTDNGPNRLMNYPTIQSVLYQGNGNYKISGEINNTVSGESPFSIEICESDKNASGYGGCLQKLSTLTNISNGTWETQVTIAGSDGTDDRAFSLLGTNILGMTSEYSPFLEYNTPVVIPTVANYPFSIVYPKDNIEISGDGLQFDWNASEDSDLKHYEIYINGKFYKVVSKTDTNYIAPEQYTPGSYTWQVIAIKNDNSVSARSQIAKFRVSDTSIFELQYPVKIEIDTTVPLFTWGEYTGSRYYRLYLDNRLVGSNIESTQFSLPESLSLEKGQTYEWYVEALNSRGVVLASTTIEAFSVVGQQDVIPAKGIVVPITPGMVLFILSLILLLYVIIGLFIYKTLDIINIFAILFAKEGKYTVRDLLNQRRVLFAEIVIKNIKHKTIYSTSSSVSGTFNIPDLKGEKIDKIVIISPGFHQFERSILLLEGNIIYLRRKEVVSWSESIMRIARTTYGQARGLYVLIMLIILTIVIASLYASNDRSYIPYIAITITIGVYVACIAVLQTILGFNKSRRKINAK